jgi:hypothetical protein
MLCGTAKLVGEAPPWVILHGAPLLIADRFTNCLSVSDIVLLPLKTGLHIDRRHEACRMAERLQLA